MVRMIPLCAIMTVMKMLLFCPIFLWFIFSTIITCFRPVQFPFQIFFFGNLPSFQFIFPNQPLPHNYRVPKKDTLLQIAKVLDVNPLNFINEISGSAENIMQTFFWLDEDNPGAPAFSLIIMDNLKIVNRNINNFAK